MATAGLKAPPEIFPTASSDKQKKFDDMHTVSKVYFRSLAALLSKNGNSPTLLHSGGPTAAPRSSLRAAQGAIDSASDTVGMYQHFCRPGLVPLLDTIALYTI